VGTYASNSDLQARLPGLKLGLETKPNTSQISQWITEGEAYLTGALRAGGISLPITDSGGIEVLKGWAIDYTEGRTRRALAAAGGDTPSETGDDLIEAFFELLRSIRSDPAFFEGMLTGSGSDDTRNMRGYVTDNADSESISDGDFAPVFTKAGGADQF